MFRVLHQKLSRPCHDKGIRILQSADSHTTIWVLVKQEDLIKSVNALHDAFQLEEETLE